MCLLFDVEKIYFIKKIKKCEVINYGNQKYS